MREIILGCLLILALSVTTVEARRSKGVEAAAPTKVARELDPCEVLALEETHNLRAYGTATSQVESVARNQAVRDARSRMALMLKSSIEAAVKDCEQSIADGAISAAGDRITQTVMQNISGSKILKMSIYDLSDGTIQVCVCVEMEQPRDEEMREMLYILNEDDVMNSKEDRDYFVAQIYKNVDAYRREFWQK